MPSIRASSLSTKKPSDPFYGQKDIAILSEFVVHRLFTPPNSSRCSSRTSFDSTDSSSSSSSCSDAESSTSPKSTKSVPRLGHFIAYAMYRTRIPQPILFSALLLLRRLKTLYPSAKGTPTSPHRLFLSSLMLSAKIQMDDTFSNRSWTVVANGGGMDWGIKEINQMERELFGFLKWDVTVHREELEEWGDECKMAYLDELDYLRQEAEEEEAEELRMSSQSNEDWMSDKLEDPEEEHDNLWIETKKRNKLASRAAEALLSGSPDSSIFSISPTKLSFLLTVR